MKEYKDPGGNTDTIDQKNIEAKKMNELRNVLTLYLLENLSGVPISAWEAWCMTQVALQRSQQPYSIIELKKEIKNQIKLFHASVRDTSRKKRKEDPHSRTPHDAPFMHDHRGELEESSNRFNDLMNFHGFVPLLEGMKRPTDPDCDHLGIQAEQLGWSIKHLLLPDDQFLDAWESIRSIQMRGTVISWSSPGPCMYDKLYRLNPLESLDRKPEPFTNALDKAIRSMKMFCMPASSSSAKPAQSRVRVLPKDSKSTSPEVCLNVTTC